MRRVVVTGVGMVSALGPGAPEAWAALLAGASGARAVTLEGLGAIPGFPADDADAARERFGRREAHRMDRAGRLAAVAAAMALEDAGALDLPPERIGCCVGSIHGGADTVLEAHRAHLQRGADRVSPLSVPLGLTNSPVAGTARVLGLRGPSAAPSTACAAGSDAIAQAISLIRDGRADAMVAGGADAGLSAVVAAGYRRMGALSPGADGAAAASRPFDVARDGFVIGEGAGMLVLEERDRALARGATVLAEAAGWGASCDAGHLTDPDPAGTGAVRAIAMALADAGLTAGEVGYVNAHATSTPAGDVAEARALMAAGLGGAAVSSTKGALGHGLGAAGGMEAVVTVLALRDGVVPPTVNLRDPDPGAPLEHIRTARPLQLRAALSNSFGFGGHNTCLAFTRHPAAP